MGRINLPNRLRDLGFYLTTIDDAPVIIPPMVFIGASEFLMGVDLQIVPNGVPLETPQHTVFVDAYFIGKYPVTVAEYACAVNAQAVPIPGSYEHPEQFLGRVLWETQLEHLDHSVVEVGWEDALQYLRWLGKLTHTQWRFPTEVEWEKSGWGTDGRLYRGEMNGM
jgi:eukaryotic-like serine/threonine-protein kinase